jgi:DNA-binding NarL/FixJ family response regulator
MNMPRRLIIADDHPLLVEGLKKVLEEIEGLEVLEPAGNGRHLLDCLRQVSVDLVLLDLHMPQLDGIETLKILSTEFPRVKVLVFTNYNQPKLIREVTLLGARGYLLKNSTSATLKEAVLAVLSGKTWFRDEPPTQENSHHLADDFIKKYQVTRRELEILRKIAKGHTSKEIGEQLFVSEFTINAHRRNICRKLDVYTPVGLVNFVQEHGLV